MIYTRNNLNSVIDNGSIKSTFHTIIDQFDPNRSKNKKTKVLDCTHFHVWEERDNRLFNIDRTYNLNGYVKNKKYDMIIYEPNCNKSLAIITVEYGKVFQNILKKSGVLIVKTKDFKIGEELKGSFDVRLSLEACKLYLNNQIIYKGRNNNKDDEKDVDIVHTYFMIFKKR